MSMRTVSWKWLVMSVLALGVTACGGGDDDPPPTPPPGPDASIVANCEPAVCEAQGMVCDPVLDDCVQCVNGEQCAENEDCVANSCQARVECDAENPCPNAGECGEDGNCATSKTVPCKSLGEEELPANASEVAADVTITWSAAAGWTEAARCAWKCDEEYVLDATETGCVKESGLTKCAKDDDCDDQGCVDEVCSDRKSVECASGEGKLTGNAHVVNPTVIVAWDVEKGGWADAEACVWDCDAGNVQDGSNCRKPVCGDGKIELDEACDTSANVTDGAPVYPYGKDTCKGALSSANNYVGEVSCKSDCTAIVTDECLVRSCSPGKSCKLDEAGATLMCNADGTGFAAGSCEEGYACNGEKGVCEISCVPGNCRFNAQGAMELCSADGAHWYVNQSCGTGMACVVESGAAEGTCKCSSGTCGGDKICADGAFEACPGEGQVCREIGEPAAAACVAETYCAAAEDCAGRKDGLKTCDVAHNTCVECLDSDSCGDGRACDANGACYSLCGDGVLDTGRGEACDDTELGGKTCADLGFASGTLACSDKCGFDYSGCVAHADANIVMSQVYVKGGAAGASYKADYVELHNLTGKDVNLHGWSLQYASATGTKWNVRVLEGIVKANGYFLVAGTGDSPYDGAELPADVSVALGMGAKGGKVALVKSAEALADEACPAGDAVMDAVIYGNATATCDAGLLETPNDGAKALVRKDFGCANDGGVSDWEIGVPAPRSSATAANDCSSSGCPAIGCVGSGYCAAVGAEITPCDNACDDVAGCVACVNDGDCEGDTYCDTDAHACAEAVCGSACATVSGQEGTCADFGGGRPGTFTACTGEAPHCAIDAVSGAGACVECTENGHCTGSDVCVDNACAAAPVAFISEYVMGSGSNKAVEIYNAGDSDVSCELALFANGSSTTTSKATVTVPAKGVHVVCNKQAAGDLKTVCDGLVDSGKGTYNGGVTAFNGDDALTLTCGGQLTDVFGSVGEDPGTAWTATVGQTAITTAKKTLRRACGVVHGVTANPASGFPTLSTEWMMFDQDTFDGLGSHSVVCDSSCTVHDDCLSGICGEDGQCATQRDVNCIPVEAEALPEHATANPVAIVHQEFLAAWPAIPSCGYACDADYHDNGTKCVSNTQVVGCSGKASIPEHAVIDNPSVTQTWVEGAWSPADTTCVWTGCEAEFHREDDACVGNSRKVDCTNRESIPAHAVIDNHKVAQTWVDGAWSPADTSCTWSSCEEGYAKSGDACVSDCEDTAREDYCDPENFSGAAAKCDDNPWMKGTVTCSENCHVVSTCRMPTVTCRTAPEASQMVGLKDAVPVSVHFAIYDFDEYITGASYDGNSRTPIEGLTLLYKDAEDASAEWAAMPVEDGYGALSASDDDDHSNALDYVVTTDSLAKGTYYAVWSFTMDGAVYYCPVSDGAKAEAVAEVADTDAAMVVIDPGYCDADTDCEKGFVCAESTSTCVEKAVCGDGVIGEGEVCDTGASLDPVTPDLGGKACSDFEGFVGGTLSCARNCLSFVTTGCEAPAKPDVVISRVYGAGGLSGAVFQNDFVELFNRESSPVSLEGWTLQYAAKNGKPSKSTTLALSGTIPANGYYLVVADDFGSVTGLVDVLEDADATTDIDIAQANGKVILSSKDVVYTVACPIDDVVDMVGIGTASAECTGVAGGTGMSKTATLDRDHDGCGDTWSAVAVSASDYVSPRNSSSAANVCE